jgi:histidinol-phosphate phosphatase family protein
MPSPYPAIFLDRDGVIVKNRMDYVKSIAEVEFIPGALEALARLAPHAARIVIVTNQSAVGRGLLTLEALDQINAYILDHIAQARGRIDGVYVCPHRPNEGCDCRKPAPGLLLRAAYELEIDLRASAMIGDNVTDMRAARAAGVRPILVHTGLGATQELSAVEGPPVQRCRDLAQAAEILLRAKSGLTKTPPAPGAL